MCSTNCSTFPLFVERNAEKTACSAHCSTIAVFVERNAEQRALLAGIDYSYKVNRNRAVNQRRCESRDGQALSHCRIRCADRCSFLPRSEIRAPTIWRVPRETEEPAISSAFP